MRTAEDSGKFTQAGFLLFLLLLFFSGMFGNLYSADAETLPVIGIQWEMKEEYVLNQKLFWLDAELAVRQGLDQIENQIETQMQEQPAVVHEELELPVIPYGEEERPEEISVTMPMRPLVVFPEYTSVFLSLDTYGPLISLDGDFLESWERVRKRSGYEDLEELFAGERDEAEDALAQWKHLAEKYRIYLIPGTFIVPDRETGELRNRFVVINPGGEIIYRQDKVYTTPFERIYLDVDGASVEEADTFTIAGKEIAVTICRDTFFEAWEDAFDGADLWIDIKANGAEFSQTEQKRFQRAVPERIDDGVSRYGMTLCLTGSFLDLFWEGESSVITEDGEVLASTRNPEDFALITFFLR